MNSEFENILCLRFSLSLSLSLSFPAHPLSSLIHSLSFSDFLVCPQGPPSISQALSAPNWTGQGASDVTYTRIINWLTKRFPLTSCPVCEATLHALVLHVKEPPCHRFLFVCVHACTCTLHWSLLDFNFLFCCRGIHLFEWEQRKQTVRLWTW